jgi:lipoyl(octanoyl) transferase
MESTAHAAVPFDRHLPLAIPRRCRLFASPPADGATNMAIDEALLRRAQRTGEAVYRLYSWSSPTVSLGRNQTAHGHYDLGLACARGVDFVRRPTGGRAILHHREITYSVAAPVAEFGSLGESYRAINRLLVEALRLHGVVAREAEAPDRTPIPGTTPCFEAPAAGELVAGGGTGGRKLVGSAQVREGDAFLQHGSILVDDDQQLLAELGARAPSMPPATLRELTGREVTVHEFAASLAAALTGLGAAPLTLTLDTSLLEEVDLLIRTRYAVADWTWRR